MPLPDLLAPTTTARRRRAATPVPRIVRSLNLAMEKQQTDNWCWAAVSVSVRKFYGLPGPTTQCQQVERLLNKTTCCADSNSCDKRFIIDPAIFSLSLGVFMFAAVKQQIDIGRVVTALIKWAEGGTHFVCIDGYIEAGPLQLVSVKDPFYEPSMIPYETLKSAYLGRGAWTDTYRS
jgi:hypothetical protein